jgi:hypothetical protein
VSPVAVVVVIATVAARRVLQDDAALPVPEPLAADAVAVAAALRVPPPNDAFASRSLLTGAAGGVVGSIVGATVEVNEPLPSVSTPNVSESVWYRWTAVNTGLLLVTVSSLNNWLSKLSALGVYNDASTLAALVRVPFAADCGGTSDSELVRPEFWCTAFAVTRGKTYALQVRAHRDFGVSGSFGLDFKNGGESAVWCRAP